MGNPPKESRFYLDERRETKDESVRLASMGIENDTQDTREASPYHSKNLTRKHGYLFRYLSGGVALNMGPMGPIGPMGKMSNAKKAPHWSH